MNGTSPQTERRRFQRIQVKAAAFILKNGRYHGSYHVGNISVGGLMLIGRKPVRPGEHVDLLLQVSGFPSIRIRAKGVHCSGPAPFE